MRDKNLNTELYCLLAPPQVKMTSYSDILLQFLLYSQAQNSKKNLVQFCGGGIFFVVEQTLFSLGEKWDQYILNL